VTAKNCNSVPFTITYLLRNGDVNGATEFATTLIGEKGINLIKTYLTIAGGASVSVTEKFTLDVCSGYHETFPILAIAQTTPPTSSPPVGVCNATSSYTINIPVTPTSPPTLPPNKKPTNLPTLPPNQKPTPPPTSPPTPPPVALPTKAPTTLPPTKKPTLPTKPPTLPPTKKPTLPTPPPTHKPTAKPSAAHTSIPTTSIFPTYCSVIVRYLLVVKHGFLSIMQN
jgi:hypothetical protein